ncbi:MAG: hypothetical protein SPL89_01165 [Clostridia bacterium]|nr:hypothetical protein [Clostridia bacterium]
MKKVLSAILVLTMVLSALTAAAVVSAEGVGREGEVTVFLRDFEDGVKRSQDAGKMNSIADDGTGNKYGAVTLTAADLANSPSITAADRRVTNALGYRLNFTDKIPYISGKEYSWSWDLATVRGTANPLGAGTSGVNGMEGNNWLLGYIDATPKAYGQYYFSIAAKTEANGTIYAKQTSTTLESGWNRNAVVDFNYKLVNKNATTLTALADGTTGTVNGLFFEVGISSTLLKLLADNKAYMGCGFGDGKVEDGTFKFDTSLANSYSFTLTEDDIFGDEAGLTDNGGKYTREQLIAQTWHPGMDCTPLKSAKREAKFQEVIDKLNFAFGIDNVTIKAKAEFFNNSVTVGEHGSVKVTTTNGVGDAPVDTVTVSAGETKDIEVNDYYAPVYEITPDAGYKIKSLTYDGKEYPVSSRFSVAAKAGAAFTVNFMKSTAIEKTRSFKTELKGGTAGDVYKAGSYGVYAASADGKLVVTTAIAGTDNNAVATDEEGYFEWISARKDTSNKRMYVFMPDTKIGSGRKYQLAFDFTNAGSTTFSMGYSQFTMRGISRYFADGTQYGDDSGAWAKVNANDEMLHTNGPGAGLSGSIPAGGSLTVKTPVYSVIGLAKKYSVASESSNKVYFDGLQFDFVEPKREVTVTPRLHAVTVTETIPYYEITANQNDENGSVKLSSDSLNFGEDNTELEIGGGVKGLVEHLMTAAFDITAPTGKLIDKVEFEDADGVVTDLSATAVNESTASVSVAALETSGTLNVTYKEQAATEPTVSASSFNAVSSEFSYAPADGGTPITVTGKTSIITYAKIEKGTKAISECGYYITKLNGGGSASGSTIKLPAIAVPEGLTYGIRAFGSAITAGNYSIQPYVTEEGGTEIKGDAKTLTIE